MGRVLSGLNRLQIGFKAIEVLLGHGLDLLDPTGDLLHGCDLKLTGAPLRVPGPADQSTTFQALEMLGHGRGADLERLRQVPDRHLAAAEARQDGPARGMCERGKSQAQRIGRHF